MLHTAPPPYHWEHLGDLRGAAGEHGRHDEIEEGHELQQVVLERRTGEEQTMLGLGGSHRRAND